MTQQDDITQRVLTAEQDPINAAILLLTEEADSISDCHTRTPGDWAGEPEAKAHYDHVRSVVDALSKLRAPAADQRGLLPCPFCGSEAFATFKTGDDDLRRHSVHCKSLDCGGQTRDRHFSEAAAIAAWNRRATLASAPVADERAQDVDLPWLRAYMHHQIASDRWVVTADQARDFARAAVLADRQARDALASAPVADEQFKAAFPNGVLTAARFHELWESAGHNPNPDRTLLENLAWQVGKFAGLVAKEASAPVAGEAQPVACLRRQIDGSDWGHWKPGSVEDGQRVTGLRSWQVRWLVDAAPQASAEPQQYTHSEVFGPMESAWNAALDQAAAVAKRISDKYAFGHYGNETDTADEIEREILALKQPQADKDGGQQLRWRVTDDMRYAVRFAPSSAHWSERLKEFFGPDAREGIDALERQLREAHAMLDRQPKLRADASALRRALIAASNYIDTLGGDSKSYRAALYAPQAEQGERKDG